MKRNPRKENTYPEINFLVPIHIDSVMAKDLRLYGNTCFATLWDMQDSLCAMCADNEMCGIAFHAQQRKAVKEWENENPKVLAEIDFGVINKQELLLWLSLSPKTFKRLIDKVMDKLKCDNRELVRDWCKGFITSHERLGAKDGVIIVKKTKS